MQKPAGVDAGGLLSFDQKGSRDTRDISRLKQGITTRLTVRYRYSTHEAPARPAAKR